jgi:hypothetical protein
VHNRSYREIASSADNLGFSLLESVFAGHGRPSYETPAEGRSLRHQGADVVGITPRLKTYSSKRRYVLDDVCVNYSVGALATVFCEAFSQFDVQGRDLKMRSSLTSEQEASRADDRRFYPGQVRSPSLQE